MNSYEFWSQAYHGKFGHYNEPILIAEYEHPGEFEEAADECFLDNPYYDEENVSIMGLLLYPSHRKAETHYA